MGISLMGYLVKGPVKLDPGNVTYATKYVDFLRKLDEYMSENGYDDETFDEFVGIHETPDALKSLFESVCETQGGYESALLYIPDLDGFVEFWNGGAAEGDSVARIDPDDPSKMMVFVGGDSYNGQEIDGGNYALVRGVYESDTISLLGVS